MALIRETKLCPIILTIWLIRLQTRKMDPSRKIRTVLLLTCNVQMIQMSLDQLIMVRRLRAMIIVQSMRRLQTTE